MTHTGTDIFASEKKCECVLPSYVIGVIVVENLLCVSHGAEDGVE